MQWRREAHVLRLDRGVGVLLLLLVWVGLRCYPLRELAHGGREQRIEIKTCMGERKRYIRARFHFPEEHRGKVNMFVIKSFFVLFILLWLFSFLDELFQLTSQFLFIMYY